MKRMFNVVFALALVLSLSWVTATPVAADTIDVPDDYDTIQEAIDAAGSGDTIEVAAGTYNEAITIDKSLTLCGPNAGINAATGNRESEAIIDPPGGTYDAVAIMDPNLGEITVDGFTVKGGSYTGICQFSAAHNGTTVHVLNNIVHVPDEGWSGYGNSIQVSGNGSTVIGNQVEVTGYNYEGADYSTTGILVNGASDALIENNYVEYVEEGVGEHHGGIDVGATYIGYYEIPPAANIQVKNNTVVGVERGIVASGHAEDTIIMYNEVQDNGIGIASESFEREGREDGVPSGTKAHYNNIVGNDVGAGSYATELDPETLDARNNWWGHASGPGGEDGRVNRAGKVIGQGDAVSGPVEWDPWLPQPVRLTPHDPVPPGLGLR